MRHTKKLLCALAIFALIATGVFVLIRIPPKANVVVFNRWFKTTLSDREISFSESGFVDSEFHASIPMSSDEFNDTVGEIGMTKTSLAACKRFDNRPWWCQEPKGDVYILDRIRQRNHRDYMEGHFNPSEKTGYFSYFNH